MLFISYVTKKGTLFEGKVHIQNNSLGHLKEIVEYEDKVLEIQADGDELEVIYDSFANLPRPTKQRVVRWFGETAAFIVHNL